MDYPKAVLEKAQRLEQLLLRFAAGEPLDELNEELDFDLEQEYLARQQAKYEAGGRTWEALIDGRHGHRHKAHSALREWLYAYKKEHKEARAPYLVEKIKERFGVKISAGHVNHLLRKRELTAPPGRPPKKPQPDEEAEEASEEPSVPSEMHDNAGLFFPRGSESGDGRGRGGRRDRVDSPG